MFRRMNSTQTDIHCVCPLWTGCITGTGNIYPKTIVKLYNVALKAIQTGDQKMWQEANRLQGIGEPRLYLSLQSI